MNLKSKSLVMNIDTQSNIPILISNSSFKNDPDYEIKVINISEKPDYGKRHIKIYSQTDLGSKNTKK